MKVLVVDDDIRRHVNFLRWLRDHTVVSVGSYEEAVQALETGSPFDVIYLDHDLGTPQNGADVATYLTRNLPPTQWPHLVVIHSWNPLGVVRIKRILNQAGMPNRIEPYGFDLQ